MKRVAGLVLVLLVVMAVSGVSAEGLSWPGEFQAWGVPTSSRGTVTLAEPVRVQWLLASPAKPEAVQWEQLLSRSDHYQWMQGGEAVYASLSLRPSGGWWAE